MIEFLSLLCDAASVVFLLGPEYREVFAPNVKSLDDSRIDEDPMTNSRGRIVPTATGSTHALWVEIRGELWKAESSGPVPPVGSEVDILSIDGLTAYVAPAVGSARASPGIELWAIPMLWQAKAERRDRYSSVSSSGIPKTAVACTFCLALTIGIGITQPSKRLPAGEFTWTRATSSRGRIWCLRCGSRGDSQKPRESSKTRLRSLRRTLGRG